MTHTKRMFLFLVTFLIVTVGFGALLNGCGGTADAQLAQDTLTWTHPTTRTDGTAFAVSEIGATLINWGPSGGPYTDGSQTVTGTAATAVVPRPLTPGTRCYIVFTRDTGMRISAASAQVCRTILGAPSAPTNLQVS